MKRLALNLALAFILTGIILILLPSKVSLFIMICCVGIVMSIVADEVLDHFGL